MPGYIGISPVQRIGRNNIDGPSFVSSNNCRVLGVKTPEISDHILHKYRHFLHCGVLQPTLKLPVHSWPN